MAWWFRSHVVRAGQQTWERPSGKAAVLLAVRGCDPSLRGTLIGLTQLDYDDYEAHIVVDNREDDAWKVVHEIHDEHDLQNRFRIHEMNEPLETCGLKCSALAQAFDQVDPNAHYLALLDADVTPHTQWLNELLGPLSDPTIGVVTGNQWFEPQSPASNGAMVRTLWNAGAIVPTALYANPWAGTCGMRMADVRRSKLAEVWRTSVVDDGPIRSAMQPLGLRVHFEPSLIMVNREQCTLEYVNRYVTRMLTWSRLHEPTFIRTVVHATASTGMLVVAMLLIFATIAMGMAAAATWLAAGLLISLLASLLGYVLVRDGVRLSREQRPELARLSVSRLLKLTAWIGYTQLVYCVSCFRAMWAREVQWREITYELESKSRVRMVSYRPYVSEPEYAQSEMSI